MPGVRRVGEHAGLVRVLAGEEARPRHAAQRVDDEGVRVARHRPCASAAPSASSGRGPSRSRPSAPPRCWAARRGSPPAPGPPPVRRHGSPVADGRRRRRRTTGATAGHQPSRHTPASARLDVARLPRHVPSRLTQGDAVGPDRLRATPNGSHLRLDPVGPGHEVAHRLVEQVVAVLGEDRLGVELDAAVVRPGDQVDVAGGGSVSTRTPSGSGVAGAADERVVEADPLGAAVDADRRLRCPGRRCP